jgi:hypothetical protein
VGHTRDFSSEKANPTTCVFLPQKNQDFLLAEQLTVHRDYVYDCVPTNGPSYVRAHR